MGKSIHRWSDEEKEYLKEITPGRHHKEITDLMNEKFEYKFEVKQIKNAIKRYGYNTGFNGQFKKGNEPWNKKKIGSERIDINGYILIKVKEPNAWRLKHRIMYEKYHNVKLTSDDAVIFADQNKLNLEKDNLILISKSQLLKMNNEKLIFNNKELTKTGANIAELMMKVDERKKKNE